MFEAPGTFWNDLRLINLFGHYEDRVDPRTFEDVKLRLPQLKLTQRHWLMLPDDKTAVDIIVTDSSTDYRNRMGTLLKVNRRVPYELIRIAQPDRAMILETLPIVNDPLDALYAGYRRLKIEWTSQISSITFMVVSKDWHVHAIVTNNGVYDLYRAMLSFPRDIYFDISQCPSSVQETLVGLFLGDAHNRNLLEDRPVKLYTGNNRSSSSSVLTINDVIPLSIKSPSLPTVDDLYPALIDVTMQLNLTATREALAYVIPRRSTKPTGFKITKCGIRIFCAAPVVYIYENDEPVPVDKTLHIEPLAPAYATLKFHGLIEIKCNHWRLTVMRKRSTVHHQIHYADEFFTVVQNTDLLRDFGTSVVVIRAENRIIVSGFNSAVFVKLCALVATGIHGKHKRLVFAQPLEDYEMIDLYATFIRCAAACPVKRRSRIIVQCVEPHWLPLTRVGGWFYDVSHDEIDEWDMAFGGPAAVVPPMAYPANKILAGPVITTFGVIELLWDRTELLRWTFECPEIKTSLKLALGLKYPSHFNFQTGVFSIKLPDLKVVFPTMATDIPPPFVPPFQSVAIITVTHPDFSIPIPPLSASVLAFYIANNDRLPIVRSSKEFNRRIETILMALYGLDTADHFPMPYEQTTVPSQLPFSIIVPTESKRYRKFLELVVEDSALVYYQDIPVYELCVDEAIALGFAIGLLASSDRFHLSSPSNHVACLMNTLNALYIPSHDSLREGDMLLNHFMHETTMFAETADDWARYLSCTTTLTPFKESITVLIASRQMSCVFINPNEESVLDFNAQLFKELIIRTALGSPEECYAQTFGPVVIMESVKCTAGHLTMYRIKKIFKSKTQDPIFVTLSYKDVHYGTFFVGNCPVFIMDGKFASLSLTAPLLGFFNLRYRHTIDEESTGIPKIDTEHTVELSDAIIPLDAQKLKSCVLARNLSYGFQQKDGNVRAVDVLDGANEQTFPYKDLLKILATGDCVGRGAPIENRFVTWQPPQKRILKKWPEATVRRTGLHGLDGVSIGSASARLVFSVSSDAVMTFTFADCCSEDDVKTVLEFNVSNNLRYYQRTIVLNRTGNAFIRGLLVVTYVNEASMSMPAVSVGNFVGYARQGLLIVTDSYELCDRFERSNGVASNENDSSHAAAFTLTNSEPWDLYVVLLTPSPSSLFAAIACALCTVDYLQIVIRKTGREIPCINYVLECAPLFITAKRVKVIGALGSLSGISDYWSLFQQLTLDDDDNVPNKPFRIQLPMKSERLTEIVDLNDAHFEWLTHDTVKPVDFVASIDGVNLVLKTKTDALERLSLPLSDIGSNLAEYIRGLDQWTRDLYADPVNSPFLSDTRTWFEEVEALLGNASTLYNAITKDNVYKMSNARFYEWVNKELAPTGTVAVSPTFTQEAIADMESMLMYGRANVLVTDQQLAYVNSLPVSVYNSMVSPLPLVFQTTLKTTRKITTVATVTGSHVAWFNDIGPRGTYLRFPLNVYVGVPVYLSTTVTDDVQVTLNDAGEVEIVCRKTAAAVFKCLWMFDGYAGEEPMFVVTDNGATEDAVVGGLRLWIFTYEKIAARPVPTFVHINVLGMNYELKNNRTRFMTKLSRPYAGGVFETEKTLFTLFTAATYPVMLAERKDPEPMKPIEAINLFRIRKNLIDNENPAYWFPRLNAIASDIKGSARWLGRMNFKHPADSDDGNSILAQLTTLQNRFHISLEWRR